MLSSFPRPVAIETRYKGYRFRSRLEARWAVFFDALGLTWDYEIEGFDLGPAGWYLPDFKVYGDREPVWVEVKPTRQSNTSKMEAFVRGHGGAAVVCVGPPDMNALLELRMVGPEMHRGGAVFADGKYSPTFSVFCVPGTPIRRNDWLDYHGMQHAVNRARGARFEHGETPQ